MAAIDLDKPGKYPIVLSDALMGLSTKEVYTGIRYNHKPDVDSSSSSSLHLQPSDSDSQEYDLSLRDNAERYSYHGVRTSGDGQYVLIFDPEKKHFVLHRIDSTFDMNLISTPWEKDPSTLQKDYAQIETSAKSHAAAPPQSRADLSANKAPKVRATAAAKSEPKKPKVEKPKKAKPVVREPTPEEADEDSDDGLTVEYPDGPSSQQYQYQPTPVFQRNASEEISDEDEDAEGEDDDMEPERNQDVDHLELPSPVNNAAGGIAEDDMELDLEAELEQALKETEGADESSESEEE